MRGVRATLRSGTETPVLAGGVAYGLARTAACSRSRRFTARDATHSHRNTLSAPLRVRQVGAGRVQHKLDRYLPAEKTQKQRAEAEARSKSTRGDDVGGGARALQGGHRLPLPEVRLDVLSGTR